MASAHLHKQQQQQQHLQQKQQQPPPSAVALTTYSTESIVHSVAAGYVAGICGVIVGHPMDSAKVWMQTKDTLLLPSPSSTRSQPSSLTLSSLHSTSALNLTAATATTGTRSSMNTTTANMSTLVTAPPTRKVSLRALYAGVSGPLVMVGLVQSVHFAIYDSTRRVLHRRASPDSRHDQLDYLHHDAIHNVALSAMTAGSVLAFFTSPLILIKTKQQIMMWDFKKAFLETLHQPRRGRRPVAATSMLQWTNFYTGFGPHFFIETVGRGIYFASYETLKRYFQSTHDVHRQHEHYPQLSPPPPQPSSNSSSITIQERCVSAAIAGMTSWAIMFPMDALRARLYSQTIMHGGASSQGALELFRSIYTQQGIMPFYRGFGVTLLRAGPVSAAILPIYDMTLDWINGR